MTDREVMQQALEALEGLFGLPNQWESGGVAVWRLGGSDASRQAMHALRTALEQPEQGAVAWQYKTVEANIFVSEHRPVDVSVWQEIEWSKPLYTTPPAAQRPWVGLTDEEIENLRKSFATRPAIAAIEAKLKEKNT